MFQYNICVGSRIIREIKRMYDQLFQYNICVGSRLEKEKKEQHSICFNTTSVSVRVDDFVMIGMNIEFQYNICVGSSFSFFTCVSIFVMVSIQHLCRFEDTPRKFKDVFTEFQYNICVGSSIGFNPKLDWTTMFQYNICVGSSS